MSDNFIKKYPIICLSSLNSELVTFPIDNTKTKMQINSTNNFSQTFLSSLKNKTLYDGLKPAIFRHFIYTGLRIPLYNTIKSTTEKSYGINIYTKIFSAFFTGGISQLASSPIDLIKIRNIAHNNTKINTISEFYRGSIPTVTRSCFNNLGYLATYDISKNYIITYRQKEDAISYSLASLSSGLISSLLSTPFDNVKSKIMSTNKLTLINCINITIKNNGLQAFYIGFIQNWLRLGPWHFIFWNSFEFYSNLFNLKTI